jgi:hypothetical protein
VLYNGGAVIHRTQIYLEDGQYEMLLARSRREDKSMAELIREALDDFLSGRSLDSGEDPLRQAIGIGKGDGSAVAENCEEFLYGEKS